MKMFKQFIKWLFKPGPSAMERYFANSTDLVQLEQRMTEVRHGNAPFQNNMRYY